MITRRSWREFTAKWRVQSSRKLLRNPLDSIYEVARKSGYSNTGGLTHAFVEEFGITPTEFRRRLGLLD